MKILNTESFSVMVGLNVVIPLDETRIHLKDKPKSNQTHYGIRYIVTKFCPESLIHSFVLQERLIDLN